MNPALITVLFGIGASLFAELVSWANKDLTGTPLQGRGAFIVALSAAVIAAAVKVLLIPAIPALQWHNFVTTATELWTVSQVFFTLIYEKLGLDVQAPAVTPSSFQG